MVRLAVLTFASVLVDIQSEHDAGIMNDRNYVVEVVLGPNPDDNSVPPIDTLNEFRDSEPMQSDLLEFLPDFIDTYPMSTREIILSKPKFRDGGAEILTATHDTVTIRVTTWEEANVTVVIVPEPTIDLLAAQVAEGYDQDNN